MQWKKPGHHLPYNKTLKEKARKLRNNPTPFEKLFWNTIRQTSFYKEITINRQKPIGNYIVDFYCHKYHLIIEIDGETHRSRGNFLYDQKRERELKSFDLRILRFSNREVKENVEGVVLRFKEALCEQGFNPPGPL